MRNKKLVNYSKYGYLFSIPFIITFLIFTLYPVVYTFILGFTDLQGNGKTTFHSVTAVIEPSAKDAQKAFENYVGEKYRKDKANKNRDAKEVENEIKSFEYVVKSEEIAQDKLDATWVIATTDGKYEETVSWSYFADPSSYKVGKKAAAADADEEVEEEEDVDEEEDADADSKPSINAKVDKRLATEALNKKSNFFVKYELSEADGSEVMKIKLSTGEEVEVSVMKVGLFENFRWVFTNAKFKQAFKNTVIIWIINFIPQLGFALLFTAWFTDRRSKVKGSGLFKILFYMPNIITAATLAILFNVLFGFPKGAVNDLLTGMHIMKEAYRFNNNEWAIKLIVAFVQFYQWYGYTMVNLIAGVIGISPEIFEAAEIDGANRVQTFFRITIPCIRQILLFVLVTSLIGGLNMFDVPELYAGVKQANGAVMTLNMFIRMVGLSGRYLYNKAAAASVIMFVIIVALSAIVFYILRDKDEAKLKKLRKKELKALKAM